MKTTLTHDTLECNRKKSSGASLMLYGLLDPLWNPNHPSPVLEILLRDPHGRFRNAFGNLLSSYYKEIGTPDQLSQYEEDYEDRESDFERRVQAGEITIAKGSRAIMQGLCWTAIEELQNEEHRDAVLAERLREFVDILCVVVS